MFFIPRNTREYFYQGCHCTVGDIKGGCVKQFAFDEFEDTVLNLQELTKEQLDLELSGQLQGITPSFLSNKRKKPPSLYMYQGLHAYKKMCCFIDWISEKRLTALKNHSSVEGVTEQLHGNMKRVPVNATTHQQTEKLKSFTRGYTNVNAAYIPGRVPGYNPGKLMQLPTLHNKLFVYEKYQTAPEDANHHPVSLWVSQKSWNNLFQYICHKTQNWPMHDLSAEYFLSYANAKLWRHW